MLAARARSQVALHAACHIARGEELYAHYGKLFDANRDYTVGEPADLRKRDIPNTRFPDRSAAAMRCALEGPTRAIF